jgi:hypothetical protein
MPISARKTPQPHDTNRDNPLRALAWAADPVAWCRDVQDWTPDPWQADFIASKSRRNILKCCRQAGKSTVVAKRVGYRSRFMPGRFTVCTAPSDRQSLELFTKIRETLTLSGDLEERPTKDNLHELVLSNGSRIICLPSNPDTIVGFSAVDELLADEAALIEDEFFARVEPMIMRSKGCITLMSTPKGQRGHFHEIWENGKGWTRFEVTWRDVVQYGHFNESDLEQFKSEHGDWMFRQEYECEFMSTIDAVFPLEQIQACLTEDEDPFQW